MSRVLAITGGVGGAKLALGLSRLLPPEQILFAVNTGDDFEHLGLHIAPDVDSLTYALAGENNTELGWGRAGETWRFIETLGQLGGEDWFRLGDRDMALHVRRGELLRAGATLTEATVAIATALGVGHAIAPMSDDPVRTVVHTRSGNLPFQHYFVRDRCAPEVTGFSFQGIEKARLNPLIQNWLQDCETVIICPSNPYVSVDPLLKLEGFRDSLAGRTVVAVSPIVGGLAIKGPAAKMMRELNVPATAAAVARHYQGLLSGFVFDVTDADQQDQISVPSLATQTIMRSIDDRVSLADETLRFAAGLAAALKSI